MTLPRNWRPPPDGDVFPLLVSSATLNSKPIEKPPTTPPDQEPNKNHVGETDDMDLMWMIYTVQYCPDSQADWDYAAAYKVNFGYFNAGEYHEPPIAETARELDADERLTSLSEIYQIGNM
jgi:hypothetical protein